MTKRKKPLKPARNPSHYAFSREGSVRHEIEEFPRTQQDIEFVVCQKFLGALKHLKGIELRDLRRGEEPADLLATAPEGKLVNIQLTEVIDRQLIHLQEMRASYREGLLKTLGRELLLFNGCRVMLWDHGDLPSVNEKDGKACLQQLAEHLNGLATEAHSLKVDGMRPRNMKTKSPERTIGVLIHRILPPGEPVRLELHWGGGGSSYNVNVSRGLLTQAVRNKISRNYAKPRGATFLLLAYAIDTLLSEDDPDVTECRLLLDSTNHPFDDVWYIYPRVNKDLGSLIHIWPC